MTDFDLTAFARQCGVAEPERFAARCEILRQFLETANRSVNLTRITEPVPFAVKHVADSLSAVTAMPELATAELAVCDMGCGAGFPSLILALAFPQLRITSVDSTRKKIDFVNAAARELGLTGLTAVQGRSNELNRNAGWRHRFDCVTARAVAESPKLALEASELPRPDGCFLFYKTPDQVAGEMPVLAGLSRKLGREWYAGPVFSLPLDGGERQFIRSGKKELKR